VSFLLLSFFCTQLQNYYSKRNERWAESKERREKRKKEIILKKKIRKKRRKKKKKKKKVRDHHHEKCKKEEPVNKSNLLDKAEQQRACSRST
jgi:hypothetical protein